MNNTTSHCRSKGKQIICKIHGFTKDKAALFAATEWVVVELLLVIIFVQSHIHVSSRHCEYRYILWYIEDKLLLIDYCDLALRLL
jgi:hypothetical protein